MIPGRLDPLAVARISLVATSVDIYNSDACISVSSTPTITANSTPPCSVSMTSTSDTTHQPINLGRQSSVSSSVTAPTLTASQVHPLASFQFPSYVFPAVGESHKERTLEQSPAYAPNFNDTSTGGTAMPPPPEPTNRSIQSSFEADYSMRSMDYLYQANFYDYIKDEANVIVVARHLNHVIKDYKLRPVACGLRWLIGDWSTDSTVRLLRSIMKEWLPDVAGLLVDLIHDGVLNNISGSSSLHDNAVSRLTAGLLKGESPAVCAVFMHSLTESWTLKAVSDLIADVDALLGWNEVYFHQFTNSYIACVIHTTSIRNLGLGGPKQISRGSIFANRHSDATISSTTTDGERGTNEGISESDSQKHDAKQNEISSRVGEIGVKEEGRESTGAQRLDGSQSGLGKSATLEHLTSIYQTNLAVCNYRLALANFKLALLKNNIQCDLNRTHALNLAASRHSSFSGSTPNLHFGTKFDEDDSEARNKKSFPKGDFRSHCESLISLRWAMPPGESSPSVSDRTTSICTLRGLDIAFGSPPTGPGRLRRVSCPGRFCHPFWHVDDEEDSESIGRAVPSVSVPSTERRSSQVSANSANEVRSTRSSFSTSDQHSARRSSGRSTYAQPSRASPRHSPPPSSVSVPSTERRSSQVSANSANEVRSTNSSFSRSDQSSARRSSTYAQSRRASSRRLIRPPPANFFRKAAAEELTIQTLNSLSRPAPNLNTTEDSRSQSSFQRPEPAVPSSEISTTLGDLSSSVPGTASQRASNYNYQTSRATTSQTSISSSSSSSSSNFYDPSNAYNHLNSPVHLAHPICHYPVSAPQASYPYGTHEQNDSDPRSLFSVPPDRIRNHHTVHVPGLVPFPLNTNCSTATSDDQEKSLSELNEFLNTNSRPVSTERLEYRRSVGVPGDSRRANAPSSSSNTRAGTRTNRST